MRKLIIAIVGGVIFEGAAAVFGVRAHHAPIRIERVPLEGRAVADLLNLRALRFNIEIPEDHMGIIAWLETWHRGKSAPIINTIRISTLSAGTDALLVRLPSGDNHMATTEVRNRNTSTRGATPFTFPADFMTEQHGEISPALGNAAIPLDTDIALHAWVAGKSMEDGIDKAGKNNDAAVILKMRLVHGMPKESPVWRDGKIVMEPIVTSDSTAADHLPGAARRR